jgi:hypothetical protein
MDSQPGPPSSPILGHLLSIGKVALKLPQRAHPRTLAAQLMHEYDLPLLFYMDTRPASIVSLVVADPYVSYCPA